MPRDAVHLKTSASLIRDGDGLNDLLHQALETEIGGVEVYTTALRCAQNKGLKKEWTKYLDETRNHERILRSVFDEFDMDAEAETPGRDVVRRIGASLVQAMEMALERGTPEQAEVVAAECVVHAETKDHLNWELIGEASKAMRGNDAKVLQAAYEEVEEEEDEHLYHTMGWCRELWLKNLGLPAILPPPEERKDVKTAIGAARAKESRKEILGKKR